MRRLVSLAALALTGFQAAPVVLPVEPTFFAEDQCLAPDFEGLGCPAGTQSDPRPTSSAALLPHDYSMEEPEPAQLLALDRSVLVEGTEVTWPGGTG